MDSREDSQLRTTTFRHNWRSFQRQTSAQLELCESPAPSESGRFADLNYRGQSTMWPNWAILLRIAISFAPKHLGELSACAGPIFQREGGQLRSQAEAAD